jgi:hypothetical protein
MLNRINNKIMANKKLNIEETAKAVMQYLALREVPFLEEEFVKIANSEGGETFLKNSALVLKVKPIYE